MAGAGTETESAKDRRVQWFIAGATMVGSAVALLVFFRSSGVGPDPLSAQRRSYLAERLRLAAIDGTISVAERQAIDSWLGSDAARSAASGFQQEIEKSLIAAALATAEGEKLIASGRRSDAMAKFREALRHDPGFLDASLNLGAAELDSGEVEAAKRRLEAGLSMLAHPPEVELQREDEFEIRLRETRTRHRFLATYNLAGCYAAQRPADVGSALGRLEEALGAFRLWQGPTIPVRMVVNDLRNSSNFRSLASNPRFEVVVEGFEALARGQR